MKACAILSNLTVVMEDLDQCYLKPLYFCDFPGGWGGVRHPVPPSDSAHDMDAKLLSMQNNDKYLLSKSWI